MSQATPIPDLDTALLGSETLLRSLLATSEVNVAAVATALADASTNLEAAIAGDLVAVGQAMDTASASATSAATAAQFLVAMGRYRATRAQGVADFAVGELFTSDEGGAFAIYQRISASPFYQAVGYAAYSDEQVRDVVAAMLVAGGNIALSNNDAGDALTVRATGIGVHTPVRPAAGNYVSHAVNGSALSTMNCVANQMDFYPFVPARDFSIDRLALYVTTGAAGKSVRIGIYADNAGAPDGAALLLDGGAFDCSSTNAPVTSDRSFAFVAGTTYWLALLSEGTPSLRAILAANVLPLAQTSGSATAFNTLRRATVAYGALPLTAPATAYNGGGHAWIGLRQA